MTNNDIIKALGCCMNGRCDDDCPFRETRENCHNLDNLILDLINRQKAEIDNLNKDLADTIALNYEERKGLKAEIERLKEEKAGVKMAYTLDRIATNNVKAEAIKEFAEMLKAKYRCYDLITPLAAIIEVDNTKKEMVGDV